VTDLEVEALYEAGCGDAVMETGGSPSRERRYSSPWEVGSYIHVHTDFGLF
jgi:hypothetical protein